MPPSIHPQQHRKCKTLPVKEIIRTRSTTPKKRIHRRKLHKKNKSTLNNDVCRHIHECLPTYTTMFADIETTIFADIPHHFTQPEREKQSPKTLVPCGFQRLPVKGKTIVLPGKFICGYIFRYLFRAQRGLLDAAPPPWYLL